MGRATRIVKGVSHIHIELDERGRRAGREALEPRFVREGRSVIASRVERFPRNTGARAGEPREGVGLHRDVAARAPRELPQLDEQATAFA